jgi:GAF domain-containing protein
MKKNAYTEGFLIFGAMIFATVAIYLVGSYTLDNYYAHQYSDEEIDRIQAQQERFTTEMPVGRDIGVIHDDLLNATCYVTYTGGISCISDAQLNRSVK